MILPTSFQFSQGSLQDFVDCRRRFYLRYVRRLAWPAVESAPVLENERTMQAGAAFHRLVQQHLLGIPAERLLPAAAGNELARWWGNYLIYASETAGLEDPAVPVLTRQPELTLIAPLKGYRLVAKFDLLVIWRGGQARIVDWKTGRKKPPRSWLEKRLQTRMYPYLLAQAGAYLNGGAPIQPEAIEMVYWFAEAPLQPERFPYSVAEHQAGEAYLAGLLETIQRLEEAEFTLTTDEKRCAFCVYRSLCDRGLSAGSMEDQDSGAEPGQDFSDLELDFEQIAEIAF